MTGFVGALLARIDVGRSWGSVLRIAAWAVAFTLVISWVVDPAPPSTADRDIPADLPASGVRYLGPVSADDLAGFVAPDPGDTDDVFTVAFVGGSELKLREVSVVGEVSNRITSVGGMPTRFDAYTLVAPRPIDALRAMESAIANGSDAIVVSLNAVWITDEWSMREWPNLDVANAATLWRDPGSWPWALALQSPADLAWRVTRALSPLVEAQQRLSRRAGEQVERLDVLDGGADGDADDADDAAIEPPTAPEPQLAGDAATFWLVDAYGPTIMDDTTERVARMVEGFDDDSPAARHFTDRLVATAESAGVPVFLYTAPFAPESAANPRFVAAQARVEAYYADAAARVRSHLVMIEPRSMTPEFADRARYFDIVHMADAGPFADVLTDRLCAQWRAADPELECAP